MYIIAPIGFGLSLLLLFLFMPLVIRLSHFLKAVAVPNERTMHHSIMPRLGGVAIFSSFIIALLLLLPWFHMDKSTIAGILLAALIIEITGILDDKYTLSAKWKALGQFIATLVVVGSGLTIDQIHIPFGNDFFFPVWISIPLTMFWIMGVINAVNWIDGLDGLAGGVSSIALITTIIIALITGNLPVVLLCSVLLGSLVGFLFFNFEPAKIFMGESGSAFIGFFLATMSIMGFKQAVFVSFIIPIVIMGVPLFDTLLAMTRRWLNHKPVYLADRGHLHHNLVDYGLTKKQAVYVMYGISCFFGACAIILTKASESQVTTVCVMILISLFVVAAAELVGIIKKKRILMRFQQIRSKR